MRTPMFRGAALLAVVLTGSACGGTSPSGGGSPGGSSSGASSSGGSSSGGSPGSSSGSGSSSGAASSSSGSGGSSGGGTGECAGTSSTAKRQPLDIYIMLDRSGSMADRTGGGGGASTKWQEITGALSSFVGQPLDGTSVGLQYFGLPSSDDGCDTCVGICDRVTGTCIGRRVDASSCNAADYARPEVEIGPIAQTASLIRASMTSQRPSGETPTSAALQGAVDHARAWASEAAQAGHAVLVVLATDGDPTWCDTDLGHIDAIAASGASANPSIRTFVIGVGDLRANLDGIAASGGTGAAYIVDTGANVTAQFLQALNDIRGKAVGCSYAIPSAPAGQVLDYGLVNVNYQPGSGGAAIAFGMAAEAAACGTSAHAWHYDNRAAPASIVLCPSTCAAVEADAAASVKIVLGCRTSGEW